MDTQLFTDASVAKAKASGYALAMIDASLERDEKAFAGYISLARQADAAIRKYVAAYNSSNDSPVLRLKLNQFQVNGQLVELAEDWF